MHTNPFIRLLSFAILLLIASATLHGAPAHAATCSRSSKSVYDPNTGQSWSAVSYCPNDGGATMYLGANKSTPVAYMDSTNSWFVCYAYGDQHEGGNNVWYYSQGDRSASGWSGHQAWGYMPAVNVWTTSDPGSSNLPQCAPDMWQAKLTVSDSNTSTSWSTVWYSRNADGATLYKDADLNTPVGYMDTTTSWFTCYAHGATHSGNNDVWYYTQGDRTVSGWEGRQAWGFMPAANVDTRSDPYDAIPACPFGSDGGGGGGFVTASYSPPPGPSPVPLRYFPVRGVHKTGAFDDTPSNNKSYWSCNDAYSKSDFNPPSHVGIDVLADEGTPVIAGVEGDVMQAEWSDYSGNQVSVVDAAGWTHYSIHLRNIASGITVGTHVLPTTVIGYIGHTGTAAHNVNHLHYSIYPGLPGPNDRYDEGTNPYPYVFAVEFNVCTNFILGLPPQEAEPLQSCGYATIWNSPSDRAIEVANGSTSNTAKVQTWDYRTSGVEPQHWIVDSAGTGSGGQALFRIRSYSAYLAGENKCLDQSTPNAGSAVYLYDCTGADNQKWYTSGRNLKNYLGGKCLDTTSTTTSIKGVVNGTALQASDCSDELDQSWTMDCSGF